MGSSLNKKQYRKALRRLQVGLVKLQRELINDDQSLLVIFEGRDASGKDGIIKRITEHLSPRDTRVVALGIPSQRDGRSWYFQRYVPHLPARQELVLFNRSWYNRAGVERVMHFATDEEVHEFFDSVRDFESLLVRSGIRLYKYYLDISQGEQEQRLTERRRDPLKQWKISPIDDAALKHWDDYSRARDDMLDQSSSRAAPWTIVRADDKKAARLAVIADILKRSGISDKYRKDIDMSPVLRYQHEHLSDGSLQP